MFKNVILVNLKVKIYFITFASLLLFFSSVCGADIFKTKLDDAFKTAIKENVKLNDVIISLSFSEGKILKTIKFGGKVYCFADDMFCAFFSENEPIDKSIYQDAKKIYCLEEIFVDSKWVQGYEVFFKKDKYFAFSDYKNGYFLFNAAYIKYFICKDSSMIDDNNCGKFLVYASVIDNKQYLNDYFAAIKKRSSNEVSKIFINEETNFRNEYLFSLYDKIIDDCRDATFKIQSKYQKQIKTNKKYYFVNLNTKIDFVENFDSFYSKANHYLLNYNTQEYYINPVFDFDGIKLTSISNNLNSYYKISDNDKEVFIVPFNFAYIYRFLICAGEAGKKHNNFNKNQFFGSPVLNKSEYPDYYHTTPWLDALFFSKDKTDKKCLCIFTVADVTITAYYVFKNNNWNLDWHKTFAYSFTSIGGNFSHD